MVTISQTRRPVRKRLLPSAISTILRDFPFPESLPKESIKMAVQSEEDLVFSLLNKGDQFRIAASLALMSARKAGHSSMILVRTSKEAKLLYRYLNPNSANRKRTKYSNQNNPNFTKASPTEIRVASTFSRFKTKYYPSARDCIIITSYDYLLRSLLHQKNDDVKQKHKIRLPRVNAYIFLDPLNENKTFKITGRPFNLTDIDRILFLFYKRTINHVRRFYISRRILSSEDLAAIFDVKKVFCEGDRESGDYDLEDLFGGDKESHFCEALQQMLLLRLYSGSPTKREIINRLKDSSLFRLFVANDSKSDSVDKWTSIIKEVLFPTVESLGLFFKLQNDLGPFAMIEKARSSNGRYSLTNFGENFLFASTYFHAIAYNPLKTILNIREKTTKDKLSWETTAEIFENYSYGRIRFADLQVLLGELTTKDSDQQSMSTVILNDPKKSYAIFQVSKFLECFHEYLEEESKKNVELLSNLSTNYSRDAEPIIGKKNRLEIERAIKEELHNSSRPFTIEEISMNLVLQKAEVKEALKRLLKRESTKIEVQTVKPPIGSHINYYSMNGFPDHFSKVCGDCHWFVKKRCTFWGTIGNSVERKIPKELIIRSKCSLKKNTVACEGFVPLKQMVKRIPVVEFAEFIPKRFIGFSDNGEELFEHFCPFCHKEGEEVSIVDFGNYYEPTQGAQTVFCPRCNTSFKLFQRRVARKRRVSNN